MKEIVFSPAVLEAAPDESFVLRFPGFTMTLMFGRGKAHAEVLEGTKRSTFTADVKDNSADFDKAVDKVMQNLRSIVRVDHKK
jgi:hypothetical protein